jgi:hypothetical protein
MNVRTSEERQNRRLKTLNDDNDDDTSAKPLNCVLLALVLVEKCRNSPRQAAISKAGGKTAEARKTTIEQKRDETQGPRRSAATLPPPRRALAEDYTPPYNLYRISFSYNTGKYNTKIRVLYSWGSRGGGGSVLAAFFFSFSFLLVIYLYSQKAILQNFNC